WIWDGNVPLHEWVEVVATALIPLPAKATRAIEGFAARRHRDELSAHRPIGPPVPGRETWCPKAPITWLFDPESFAPMAKVADDVTYAIVRDHLGCPSAMHDADGAEVWSATLDSYGDVHNLTGARQDCPFRWPGQYEDSETGLYYNRFRYYDPGTGAYVAQDRIGLLGGLHPYRYVFDPNRAADPLGPTKCGLRKGEPLPDDAIVHRIGGGKAPNLRLKAAERKLTPPGISTIRAESPEEAARLAKEVANEHGWSRMATAAETMGSATAADIRSAGFDVI